MPRPEDMRQSRLMSLVEAVANVAVGYVVALATQLLVFPIFGLSTRLAANMMIGHDLHCGLDRGNGGAKVDQGSGVMVALRAA